MDYGLELSSSSSSSSSEDEAMPMNSSMKVHPRIMLNLAVSKRRKLLDMKERDFRCEILQNYFIQRLTRHLRDCRNNRIARKRSRSFVIRDSQSSTLSRDEEQSAPSSKVTKKADKKE
ncbi:uncharacterized protein CELE_D1086.19 [Caenorhabditis elegans]|uniref:Uncharacterized protein n=1 Tax=Caenorhabditis elegans TaxID=6239 RepID=A5JYW8_CAEEL|nr:Uncharacterized protein CELE_D1086.19 [Caenorhabditis elegans]CAN86584.1 Uncharacterized protein CELE_D1086.19 [Caenorhabditis elegans]|eukprot:NP_001122898.1 Uncharacterized protein CELE_D1086.19 [Caenorhabditis elegans]